MGSQGHRVYLWDGHTPPRHRADDALGTWHRRIPCSHCPQASVSQGHRVYLWDGHAPPRPRADDALGTWHRRIRSAYMRVRPLLGVGEAVPIKVLCVAFCAFPWWVTVSL